MKMFSFDKLLQNGNWRKPATEVDIRAYEHILGVCFPEDYRHFLLKYGAGSINGVEIAGCDAMLISDMNVIGKTVLQLRSYRYFPQHFIFFSDTGDGGQIVFDRNTWHVYEVYARPPKDLEQQQLADSFTAFLELKLSCA